MTKPLVVRTRRAAGPAGGTVASLGHYLRPCVGDRDSTRFIWRPSPADNLREAKTAREVRNGDTSSSKPPFIPRTIHHVLQRRPWRLPQPVHAGGRLAGGPASSESLLLEEAAHQALLLLRVLCVGWVARRGGDARLGGGHALRRERLGGWLGGRLGVGKSE